MVAECLSSGGVVRVIMAMSQERSACLGLWVLLLLGAGMKEVVEGCSCHPAHPQQLFCSAEIGKLTTEATTAAHSRLCSVLFAGKFSVLLAVNAKNSKRENSNHRFTDHLIY